MNKKVILLILKSYTSHWYHTFILHAGIDRMEAMIFQYLYWPRIKKYVWKKVINGDTFQRIKQSNIQYGKLPSEVAG